MLLHLKNTKKKKKDIKKVCFNKEQCFCLLKKEKKEKQNLREGRKIESFICVSLLHFLIILLNSKKANGKAKVGRKKNFLDLMIRLLSAIEIMLVTFLLFF